MPLQPLAVRWPLGEIDALRIASGVLFLRQYSPLHVQYPLEMVHRRIGPSLPLGQFRFFAEPLGDPIAFCNWAWLSAPVLDEVLATGRDLLEDEFCCGPLPLFYEFLAPFGHCRAVARVLRDLPCFEGLRVPAIRVDVRGGAPARPRLGYFHF